MKRHRPLPASARRREPGIGKQHVLDRHVELLAERGGEIGGDAARLAVVVLHDEEDRHRRRETSATRSFPVGVSSFMAFSLAERGAGKTAPAQSAGFRIFIVASLGIFARRRVPSAIIGRRNAAAIVARDTRVLSMNIVKSVARYEAWLRNNFERVRREGPQQKHKKMAADAFQFLRATYWRWAETILDVCPRLGKGRTCSRSATSTWRISAPGATPKGRLIWGVNDFDEAARMPYAIDIVRLAASAVLADVRGISERRFAPASARLSRGLTDRNPFVLDRDHQWLRDKFVVTQDERTKFWAKFDPARNQENAAEERQAGHGEKLPLRHARRSACARRTRRRSSYYARTAGTGSLGRPRFFGSGLWQGDLIVREAKAMLRSGWTLAQGGSRSLRCLEIASGRYRSPDPSFSCAATCWCAAFRRTTSRSRRPRRKSRQSSESSRAGESDSGQKVGPGRCRCVACDGARHRGDPLRDEWRQGDRRRS
jgi:hypothetical protein